MNEKQKVYYMKCPKCRSKRIAVINTRGSSNNTLRRRRECANCENRFTTYERIVQSKKEVKKDGKM